jgi:hypothetical protein
MLVECRCDAVAVELSGDAIHIHCASAILTIRDDLPPYAGLPAKRGGADTVRVTCVSG